MVLFPNAKLNLGLYVTQKRPDGYHNIETCFYPVAITDILEFVESRDKTSIQYSGNAIPGDPQENLCIKAWNLLHEKYRIPSVAIHLHKHIPIGAGLGGGSSDAAFMLKGLNEFFQLGISTGKLEEFASGLGSDCAFFIRNTPCFAEGRGEILTPINLDLSKNKIVLINPGIHISTSEAYSMVTPKLPLHNLRDSLKLPITNWQHSIYNDFEQGVFQKHPKIAQIKKRLLSAGAIYAAMSGSGSSVYGIFESDIPQNFLSDFNEMFCWYSE